MNDGHDPNNSDDAIVKIPSTSISFFAPTLVFFELIAMYFIISASDLQVSAGEKAPLRKLMISVLAG